MKLNNIYLNKSVSKILISLAAMSLLGCSAITGNGVTSNENTSNTQELSIPISRYSESLFGLEDLFNMNGGKSFPLSDPREQFIDTKNISNASELIIAYHNWGNAQLITPEICQFMTYETATSPAFSNSPDVLGLVYKSAFLDTSDLSNSSIRKFILPLVTQSILVLNNSDTASKIFNTITSTPSSCWRNVSVSMRDGSIKTINEVENLDLNFYKGENILVVSSTEQGLTTLFVYQKIGNVINKNWFLLRNSLVPKDIGWGFLNNFLQDQTAKLSNLQQIVNPGNFKVTELSQYNPDLETISLPQLSPPEVRDGS
jgi:hypothetical protein